MHTYYARDAQREKLGSLWGCYEFEGEAYPLIRNLKLLTEVGENLVQMYKN